jgi:hypothetical protein
MFTQPSVNQIASTYQGSPAPLARKVDQDKKQNGGIPKDLRQLMALNDIAQGKNAMGIQQALQIPTNMPTVAQNTQQLAQQALQSRMMQMAREQQRLQQKPPILPEGTPQPKDQPQGIDALTTNVGDAYAEGGIIGFDGTKSSSVQDPAKKEEEATSQGGDILRAIANAISGGLKKSAEYGQLKEAREEAMPGFLEALTPTQRADRLKQAALLRTQMGQVVDNGEITPTYPKAGAPTFKTYAADSQRNAAEEALAAENSKLFNLAATPNAPAVAPTKVKAPSPAVNTGIAGAAGAGKAPSVQAALDKAGIISLPVDDKAQKRMTEIMNMDPAAEERLAQEKFKQQVGNRDLSIYDRTAAELEARKQKLNAPKAGYDAMMEYLEQVALGGGRTSAESGSIGAARQRQLQLSRQNQQNELMDKILELGGKKSEAEYNQKLNMYQIGQKRYEDVFKNVMDATKDMRMSETERMKMAQQAVIAQMDNDAKLRAAQISAGGRDDLAARAAAIRAENKGMSVEESIKRAAMATYAGQTAIAEGKNTAATEKAIDTIRAGYAKTMKFLSPDSPLYKRQQTMMEQDIAEARRKDIGSGLPDALPAKKPEGVTVTKIGS